MPSPKKVAWSQLRVGIMGIAAIAILFSLVLLLFGARNPFAKSVTAYTFMDDSAAMTEGSAVRLNGILVGKVSKIALSGDPRPGRIIRMDLQINEQYMKNIPVDSKIGFAAENVLGSKFLNIRRGTAAETIREGSEIQALQQTDFLELVSSAQPLLESIRSILTRVDAIVGQVEVGKGSLGKLLTDEELYNRLNGALGDVRQITSAVAAGKGTLGKLLYDEALYQDLRGTLGRLDAMIAEVQQGNGTIGKLLKDPALYNEFQTSAKEIRTLLADLNSGKGTAGKLLKDTELHERMVALVNRINSTLDRVNSGEGTLGQLLVNPQLYESLNGTTREIQSLMKDFRANPKKFLTIQLKLF